LPPLKPYQPIDLAKAVIQPLANAVPREKDITVAALRLDCIHPVVSGNKWFKLKYYISQALAENNNGIITSGGAWSNHLVATACACKLAGLSSVGIIRGERPVHYSLALRDAISNNMRLEFVSRAAFANQRKLAQDMEKMYAGYTFVTYGGQGNEGLKGAAEIMELIPQNSYTHICCAVGTGTTLAGIVKASKPEQKVIGICSLKMTAGADNTITQYVKQHNTTDNFEVLFNYHFGGYARFNSDLINFMNELYKKHKLPTDFVYTGKLLYGVMDLIQKDHFPAGSRILVIHSGGLQGNRSLPRGTLVF
jgi:D-cysteine desulfhydrase